MNHRKLENFITWGSLLVYAAVWLYVSKLFLFSSGKYLWFITGLVPGVMYCAGQAYEILYRGHCYLSADPTALPLALYGIILVFLVVWVSGNLPENGLFIYVEIFAISFGVGHIAALVYGFLMTILLAFIV